MKPSHAKIAGAAAADVIFVAVTAAAVVIVAVAAVIASLAGNSRPSSAGSLLFSCVKIREDRRDCLHYTSPINRYFGITWRTLNIKEQYEFFSTGTRARTS